MPKSAILLKLIIEQKCMYRPCLLPCGSQQAVQLPAIFSSSYFLRVPHCSHHAFRALGLLRGFRPYICPKSSFPVKTIQTTTSQVYLHKLQATGVESLIPKRRRYPRHNKWPVTEALVGKGGRSRILEAFAKELDVVG